MDARASYEEDVYLWSQQQAKALREAAAAGSNLPLDWENVAEEIESVGRSELRALAARGLARDGISTAEVPTDCPWTLTQLLDDDFWPENRHGLE